MTEQLRANIDMSILDKPGGVSLTGAHARLATRSGRAARFLPDVSAFGALEDETDPAAWADLARLLGTDGSAIVAGVGPVPDGWETIRHVRCVQLVGLDVKGVLDEHAEPLTNADVPEVLDLVGRTEPGPFSLRTIELGDFVGIRHHGRLIAMAGERLRLPGWTEVSGVCTDPLHRGNGLASRLISTVAANIHARGHLPFLHAAAENDSAIRLYHELGFRHRMDVQIRAVRPLRAAHPPTATAAW
jgi:GNAT superfamily N-acetyltransferase